MTTELSGIFESMGMAGTRSTLFQRVNEPFENIIAEAGPGCNFVELQDRLVKNAFMEIAHYLESLLQKLSPHIHDTLPELDPAISGKEKKAKEKTVMARRRRK